MDYSRRDLLKWGLGSAALLATGARSFTCFAAEGARKKIPIAVQLYSVRDVAGKDLPGTLKAIADMGYEAVEFAGYYGKKAEELRKLLDDNGLKCCGTHTGLTTLTGDALKATADFNKTLGNQFLIVPALPKANMASVAALLDTAKVLSDMAERAKEMEMRVGFHAHGIDFRPVADRIPWDLIFSNASLDVIMQLDTGNCMEGGGDPIAVLKTYPGRALSVHLKEHGPKGAVVGEGDVPWREVFELCETIGGTQWYVVEQETYKTTSLESVRNCLDNLRKMGK